MWSAPYEEADKDEDHETEHEIVSRRTSGREGETKDGCGHEKRQMRRRVEDKAQHRGRAPYLTNV